MIWIILFTVLVLVGLVHTALLGKSGRSAYELAEAGRPAELLHARVVESRTRIAMTSPFKLHGEPDVIYQLPNGTLVVREDKAGTFAHSLADRIQLSVYAAILRHQPPDSLRGAPVSPYGYMRYGMPGKTRVRWQRMPLFNDEELRQLIGRYQSLRHGARPTMTTDTGYCKRRCAHYQGRCPGAR